MTARRWSQVIGTVFANPFVPGLINGRIFQGKTKGFCFPGLNCYSCPLALYSCPIGNIQHFMANVRHRIALYTIGMLGIIGAVGGRIICGWFCPFGLLQELLFKIPTRKFKVPRFLYYGKYVALILLVLLLPALTHQNWYSRLCPAGTLEAGLPLLAAQRGLGSAVGWFFWLKVGILVAFILWMVVSMRPFCRTACPLGAIYGLLNPVSIFRIQVDERKCNQCGVCSAVCPVDIDVVKTPNSPECIRCLKCVRACPENALEFRRRSRVNKGSPASINSVE